MRRQYKSPCYYEAKAQLMLRITEITADPDVIVRFFNLATTWLNLANQARQEEAQHNADSTSHGPGRTPQAHGTREAMAGFSELSAAKDG